MPRSIEPTPAKQAQDSARSAQETSAAHAQALGELQTSDDLSNEDKAVLGEWALESQGLKADADKKVKESRTFRKGSSYAVDESFRVLLDREVQEIAAGVDRNPPVGGRVG